MPTSTPSFLLNSRVPTSFGETTGFDMVNLMRWIGTDLISPFLGSVFLFLDNLKIYLIVFLVFGATLTLVYNAYKQFYKH